MALLFLDGVDSYQTIGGALYGPTAPNIGYYITQTASSGSQVTVGEGTNTSSRSFAIARATNGVSRVSKQVTSQGTQIAIGFAMKASARQTIVKITDLFEVLWPATGKPTIGEAAGPTIPILNTWYYWELVIDKTAKTVDVWLNGYQQFQTTFTADVPETIEVSWGWNEAGAAAVIYVDDIYIVDDVAVDPNSNVGRLGPIEIATRLPTANVQTQWKPNPTTKEGWKILSQIPALQNEYVESNVVGAQDLYSSSTAVTKDVIAVAVTALTAKTDIDDHAIALVLSDGTTAKEGTPIDLSTQYTYVQSVFESDPTGEKWTASSASSASFGIKVK